MGNRTRLVMIQRSHHHILTRTPILPLVPVMTLKISNCARRRCSLALLCIAAAIFGQSDSALASRPGPTPSVMTSPMGGGLTGNSAPAGSQRSARPPRSTTPPGRPQSSMPLRSLLLLVLALGFVIAVSVGLSEGDWRAGDPRPDSASNAAADSVSNTPSSRSPSSSSVTESTPLLEDITEGAPGPKRPLQRTRRMERQHPRSWTVHGSWRSSRSGP